MSISAPFFQFTHILFFLCVGVLQCIDADGCAEHTCIDPEPRCIDAVAPALGYTCAAGPKIASSSLLSRCLMTLLQLAVFGCSTMLGTSDLHSNLPHILNVRKHTGFSCGAMNTEGPPGLCYCAAGFEGSVTYDATGITGGCSSVSAGTHEKAMRHLQHTRTPACDTN